MSASVALTRVRPAKAKARLRPGRVRNRGGKPKRDPAPADLVASFAVALGQSSPRKRKATRNQSLMAVLDGLGPDGRPGLTPDIPLRGISSEAPEARSPETKRRDALAAFEAARSRRRVRSLRSGVHWSLSLFASLLIVTAAALAFARLDPLPSTPRLDLADLARR